MLHLLKTWAYFLTGHYACKNGVGPIVRRPNSPIVRKPNSPKDILMVNIWRFFSQHPKGFEWSFVIHISINEGVLINVLVKQTEGVKIYFVIYLEKIKKQSRTERLIKQFIWGVGVNDTFNNISVLSCRSVLLVEETGALSHNIVSSTSCVSGNRIHNVSGDKHWLHR